MEEQDRHEDDVEEGEQVLEAAGGAVRKGDQEISKVVEVARQSPETAANQ